MFIYLNGCNSCMVRLVMLTKLLDKADSLHFKHFLIVIAYSFGGYRAKMIPNIYASDCTFSEVEDMDKWTCFH